MGVINDLSELKYAKNGFSIMTLTAVNFTLAIDNQRLTHRGISNPFYKILNNNGSYRRYGYVAFTYDNAYWGKTKKEAIQKLKDTHNNIFS